MRRRIAVSAALGSLLMSSTALSQTPPNEAPIDLDVTAKRLDQARGSIQPSLGATVYDFSKPFIENVPLGENAP